MQISVLLLKRFKKLFQNIFPLIYDWWETVIVHKFKILKQNMWVSI